MPQPVINNMDFQNSHLDTTNTAQAAGAQIAAADIMRQEAYANGGQKNNSEQTLSDSTITQCADAIRDALGIDKFLGLGAVDKEKIIAIIAPMDPTDKELLEVAYDRKYGNKDGDLQQIIRARMTTEDFFANQYDNGAEETLNVLNRTSSEPNFAQRIQVALDRIKSAPSDDSAQKDLLSILSVMNSQETKAMIAKFTNGGTDASLITNNAAISDKTSAIASVYLKGVDKITDNDLIQLANMALDQKDHQLFNEVMSRTSQSARDSYSVSRDVPQRIKEQFYWADQDLSLDYLRTGHAGLTTLVKENTHWLHQNKSAIKLAIDNATAQERQLYATGRKWEQEKVTPVSPADRAAAEFYKTLHAAFKSAAYDWEVQGWESRLISASDTTLIEAIANTHYDGLLGSSIGSGTNTDKLFGVLKNMSAGDWTKLTGLTVDGKPMENGQVIAEAFKADLKAELDALGLNAWDRRAADAIVDEKTKAVNFSESTKTDDILKVQANYSGFLGIGRDSEKLMDGLVKISQAQQKQYRSDADFKAKVDAYVGQLDDGAQKILGKRILEKIGQGSDDQPLALDKLDLVILHSLDKNMHPLAIVEEMETLCHADDNARATLSNNADLQAALREQLARAIERENHQGLSSIFAAGPAEQIFAMKSAKDLVDGLVKDGYAPIQLEFSLAKDQRQQFQVMLSASPQEAAQLMDNSSPADNSLKDIKDGVGDKTFVLAQNIWRSQSENQKNNSSAQTQPDKAWINTPAGKMQPADLARATALKLVDPSILLNAIKSGQINHGMLNAMQNQYQAAYGDNLVGTVMDVLSDADKKNFQQEIAAIPKTAKEDLLERSEKLQKSYSILDDWMKEGWDATKVEAEAQLSNYSTEFAEAARRLENLSEQEKSSLNDAFDKAVQLYQSSKTELAEDVWAAAITAVGVIPNPFSLAGMMLFAGGSRVLVKAAMEGSDYRSDGVGVLKDVTTGAAMGAFLKLTPGIIDRVVPVAESVGGAIIKPVGAILESTPVAQTATSISVRVNAAIPGALKETAKEAAGAAGKLLDKQFKNAAESGFGGGFTAGAIDQALDWDTRKTPGENFAEILKAAEESGEQGLKTALLVHLAFRGFSLGKSIAESHSEYSPSLSLPKTAPRTAQLREIRGGLSEKAIAVGEDGIVLQRDASGALKIVSGKILDINAAETPVMIVPTKNGKVPWAVIAGDMVKDFDQMSVSDQTLVQQILQSAGYPISALE